MDNSVNNKIIKNMKTLILGMGNTLLSDDGIGIITKRFLERQLAYSYNIDF